jgi:hypothetical protein
MLAAKITINSTANPQKKVALYYGTEMYPQKIAHVYTRSHL